MGERFYEGYCDDPRNTDNAWLEIVAYNYRDYNYALSNAIEQVLLHCIFNSYFVIFDKSEYVMTISSQINLAKVIPYMV